MVSCFRVFFLVYLFQFTRATTEDFDGSLQTGDSRQKRGAVYPIATVIQFAIALAYPIEIPKRKAATNLGILLNIDLPFNITQLYPYIPETVQARSLSHNAFYNDFEWILNEHGYNGQECILKSICQIAGKNTDEDDLSHSFLQLLFRPRFLEGCNDSQCRLIKEARVAGLLNADCNYKYKMCPSSLLDLISL